MTSSNRPSFSPAHAPLGSDPTPEDLERLARKRAALKMGWIVHASIYAMVNLLLTSLSLYNGSYWAVFPALGWGVGLLAHALAVYVASGGGGFYARMVQRERARIAHAAQPPHLP